MEKDKEKKKKSSRGVEEAPRGGGTIIRLRANN